MWQVQSALRSAWFQDVRSGRGIDLFLLVQLNKKAIRPAGRVEAHVLLRRVYLDLTGLIPTEKAVDRLFASPRYGEHWGRHWLDLARYADPTATTTRTRSGDIATTSSTPSTKNMPYDQLVLEQSAGDLICRQGIGFTVDLDPRWVIKLIKWGEIQMAERYKQHVVDQSLTILKAHPSIKCMFTTPKLLEAIC